MEIKRTKNTIITTLSDKDFEKYDIYPSDFTETADKEYLANKINNVVEDVLEKVNVNEDLEGSFQVTCKTNNNNIIIEIEKVVPAIMPIFDDFMKHLMNILEKQIKDVPSNTYRMIEFRTLSELIDSLNILSPIKINESSVIKHKDKFYLKLGIPEEEMQNIDIILGEFFSNIVSNNMQMSMIEEHSDVIVDNDAIKKLISI